MRLHPKIQQLKKNDAPIIYRNLSVDKSGKLQSTDLDKRIVKGYGVIWGSENDYGEIFVKGSMAKAISDLGPDSNSAYKIKFRDEHGRACALFNVLKEDDIGLYFETKPLDEVQWCNDMLVQLRSGTINNFSIGFKHVWDKVEWDDENDRMINLEARLYEISGVSIPSDMETYATRSLEEIEYLQDDIEEFILSLPKSAHLEARKICTRCLSLREQVQPERESLEKKQIQKTGLDFKFLIDKL